MKIVLATQNAHKIEEMSQILAGAAEVLSLSGFPLDHELPETGQTLRDNALEKARYVAQKFGVNCLADDTGLEVDVLNGAPGVYSARYAGEEKNPEKNMEKLLRELQGQTQRTARFKTVLALILDGQEFLFEGTVEGTILSERQGDKGFGYDPVFLPDGFSQSFAEMDPSQKNAISHRGRALQQLKIFLAQR
jgi:XTP/dITP diphosphohydrolase